MKYTRKRNYQYTRTRTTHTIKYNAKDKILNFIDTNIDKLLKGYVFHHSTLDKPLFNHLDKNCICENIFNNKIKKECECDNIELYPSQGKSRANIYSINCSNSSKEKKAKILKVMSFSNYYIRLNQETKKYIYLETDRFTIQTLIHYYVYKDLPTNCIKLNNFGICKNPNNNDTYNKYYGYNLMDKSNMGDGNIFINGLVEGKYDKVFALNNLNDRHNAIMNFFLQSICIKGHLQSSSLELLHGDYKPNNLFINYVSIKNKKYFEFNVFGRIIKIKNMGFAVLIADFGTSSINLDCRKYKKNYRIVSTMLVEKTRVAYINNIIKTYADIEPDNYKKIKYSKNIFNTELFPIENNNIAKIIWTSGVKLYLDFDLYIYIIKLLNMPIIKKYIIDNSLNKTIFSYIDEKMFLEILKYQENEISINRILLLLIDICEKYRIYSAPIFTNNYIDLLDSLSSE